MINIKEVSDREYNVDGVQVVKDQNGKWCAISEMTTKQIAAFQKHLISKEN